ncbi:glycosyltransferase family 4 protein [Geminisphaera colitermitum]|uniref:glycosyltransferase family 4 protein n=1 Tax=Geminisphaera colitermitum TaxID=1148786 RepID=UPI000158D5E1|nr:glycosyltransferase family 4 protein [Geminisphaera colitermitum]
MIVFLNRFYHPSTTATGQLLTDLAEGLAARGHAIAVVASRHDASLPENETRNNVRIHRIGTPSRRRGFMRVLEFRAFRAAALRQLHAMLTPSDTVVALTDPPLIGVTAAQACHARGARLIHWTQDIYPELLSAAGPGWPALPLVSLLRPRRDRAWRDAARCVTLGEDMAALLRARGVPPGRLTIIPNWAPAGLTPPPPEDIAAVRARWALDDQTNGPRFIVAYSGNLGRVHDFTPCINVAATLRDDPRFGFIFVGEGARKSWLQRTVAARGLKNVVFRPHEPRQHLAVSLAAADAHWVTLREGCEHLVFPSKLYGIAAVGRPVLFAGHAGCELTRLVERNQLGLAAPPHDTAAFVRALRRWIDTPLAPAACDTAARSALAFARAHAFPHALDAWGKALR